MKVVKLEQARKVFDERRDTYQQEMPLLMRELNDAILAVRDDNVSTWSLNGRKTNRVIFMDVSGYLEETVTTVTAAYQKEGYACNLLHMADGDSAVDLLVVMWEAWVCNIPSLVEFTVGDGEENPGFDADDEGVPTTVATSTEVEDVPHD